MTVFTASAKVGAVALPSSGIIAYLYAQVNQSPVTWQNGAISFAGVCALALVGAIVSTRDTTNKSATKIDTILLRLDNLERRYESMSGIVQTHEGALGQFPAAQFPTHFPEPKHRKPK